MASIDVRGLDEFISELDTLQFDEIAPEMLKAGVEDVKSAMESTTSSHIVSGSMHNSVKAGNIKHHGDRYDVFVYPAGSDPEGTSNMEKACYMEYGTSHQGATPIIEPAVLRSESAALKKMKQKFDELTEGLEL